VTASTPARRPALAWGLAAFVWLLPLHTLTITVLYGALGWPAATVRAIAAWKEALIAVLVALAAYRTWRSSEERAAGPEVRQITWLDLTFAALGILSLGYLMGANTWFGTGLPVGAELYGLRDTAFVSLLYFVGRASPEVAEQPQVLRALFVVGVVTSLVAIVERIVVTPEMLVLLGASRYVQEFLGAAAITSGNAFGLPDNYWTNIGGHLVQRAGSTFLSGQSFAIPFLLILPAATLWALAAQGRRAVLRWLGYIVLWVGLLLSVTRMTIAIGALEVLIVAAARRRWALLVTLGSTAVVGLAVGMLIAPGLAGFVWDTLTWQTASSITHLGDWTSGFDNLVTHPLGVGLGATDIVAARFGLTPLTADNQYLRYGVELGVLGLVLHVAVLGGALVSGVRVWTAGTDRSELTRDYGLLLAVTGLGVVLNAATAVVFNSMMLAYPFFWLTGALSTIARRRVPVAIPSPVAA
jgi:hypothetical protein